MRPKSRAYLSVNIDLAYYTYKKWVILSQVLTHSQPSLQLNSIQLEKARLSYRAKFYNMTLDLTNHSLWCVHIKKDR